MAVKYWEAPVALYEFDYDTGTHSPVVGEVINVDVEAAETATIAAWTVASGSWGGSNAAGKMWVYSASATFISNLANNDNIDDPDDNQICITTGGVTTKEGDWQSPGNWGTGEDPSVPVVNDEVIFDARSITPPISGMLDSESGATGQGNFDLLHFKKGWDYGCATEAEPLCCSPDKLIIEGAGTYYILCGESDQSTDTGIGMTIIMNKAATVYLYSNVNSGGFTALYQEIYILAGTLYVAYYSEDTSSYGCAITYLYLYPKNNKASNITVYIEKEGYDIAIGVGIAIYMNNGTLTIDSKITYLEQKDGVVNYGTDLDASPLSDLDITTLRQSGGIFNWYPDDTSNPTITNAWIFSGSFISSGSINADRAKLISNLYSFTGSAIDFANHKGNLTITNWYNYGAVIKMDSGVKIAITYNQP